MVRKVYESVGDRRFAALKQGLGGSGTTSEYQAAQKLGLLTTTDAIYLKTSTNGKVETVSNYKQFPFFLSPIDRYEHCESVPKKYRVHGTTSSSVSTTESGVTISVVSSDIVSIVSGIGKKTIYVKNVPVTIDVISKDDIRPVIHEGQTINLILNTTRYLTATYGIGLEYLGLKEVVGFEWEVTKNGTVTIEENQESFRVLNSTSSEPDKTYRVRAKFIDQTTSPWSLPTVVRTVSA